MAEEQGQVSPKKASTLTREAAKEINSYSSAVDNNIDSIEENLEFMMNSQKSYIEFADPNDPEHRKRLEEQKTDLAEFVNETEGAIEGLDAFRQEAEQLRGISRELTQSVNKLSSVLTTLTDSLTETNAKATRMISLINQELDGEEQVVESR